MKKNKIFKRCFALFIVVVLMFVFAINSFASSWVYEYNADNTVGGGEHDPYDYQRDGNTIVTSAGSPVVTYMAQSVNIIMRFYPSQKLEAGKTYVLIWFVLSAGNEFNPSMFRVFDGGDVFYRGVSLNYNPMQVEGITLNEQEYAAYYNKVTIPSDGEDKYIASLACFYYGDLLNPITFVPFIIEVDEENAPYFVTVQDEALHFINQHNYSITAPYYSLSQINKLNSLHNDSYYTYDEGYEHGFSSGSADKENYGKDKYQQGVKEGQIAYELGLSAKFEEIRQQGYDVGYEKGLLADEKLDFSFRSMIFTVLESPFNVAKTIFNFELLGINLASFFFSLLTFAGFVKLYKTFKP